MSVTIGNPAPLGLLAFGMTTLMLMYVDMGWVEHEFEAVVYGTALWFGGVGQLVVAIFELLKGSSFSFAVFGSYSFFWLSWAFVFVERHRTTSELADFSYPNGMTAFFIQWGILSACFWVITWRKNLALIVIFFLLTTTFFLLAAANAKQDANIKKAAGYVGFATACGAFYTAIAELVNEEWGRHILPGLKPIHMPERLALDNAHIASRVSYDKLSNTLMLYFSGLQITTIDAVNCIREEVEKAILNAKAPENKVHVIVDYKDVVFSQDVMEEYWAMAHDLERKYYLSARRFAVSSFGTRQASTNPLSVGTRMTAYDSMVESEARKGPTRVVPKPARTQGNALVDANKTIAIVETSEEEEAIAA